MSRPSSSLTAVSVSNAAPAPPSPGKREVRLRLRVTERGDGGIRVRSDDVPGLLATGHDAAVLWRQLPAMIEGLLRANLRIEIKGLDLGPPPVVGEGQGVDLTVTAETRAAS